MNLIDTTIFDANVRQSKWYLLHGFLTNGWSQRKFWGGFCRDHCVSIDSKFPCLLFAARQPLRRLLALLSDTLLYLYFICIVLLCMHFEFEMHLCYMEIIYSGPLYLLCHANEKLYSKRLIYLDKLRLDAWINETLSGPKWKRWKCLFCSDLCLCKMKSCRVIPCLNFSLSYNKSNNWTKVSQQLQYECFVCFQLVCRNNRVITCLYRWLSIK